MCIFCAFFVFVHDELFLLLWQHGSTHAAFVWLAFSPLLLRPSFQLPLCLPWGRCVAVERLPCQSVPKGKSRDCNVIFTVIIFLVIVAAFRHSRLSFGRQIFSSFFITERESAMQHKSSCNRSLFASFAVWGCTCTAHVPAESPSACVGVCMCLRTVWTFGKKVVIRW